MKNIADPKYSICMCNFNMADTLPLSLSSILDQLDPQNYEIVLVDDGSSDNSIDVIEGLQKKYHNLRLVKLQRDSSRKLGATRNISIEHAKGEYVLLHIDCDDEYGPHINDFVTVFHQIEKCFDYDILLSGQHVNMARRSFLLEHGPYRNLFRAEDRDLWIRLSSTNAYIPLEHKSFVKRLPKKQSQNLKRIFLHTWDQMVYDFRTGLTTRQFLQHEQKKWETMSLSLKVLRLLYLLPAYITAQFKEPVKYETEGETFKKIAAYREKMSGTMKVIMERQNQKPNFSTLTKNGQKLFDI